MAQQQPHKKIYLQDWNDPHSNSPTWCEDQINEDDIEYILKSEFDKQGNDLHLSGLFICKQRNHIEKLKETLIQVVEKMNNNTITFASMPFIQDIQETIQKTLQEVEG